MTWQLTPYTVPLLLATLLATVGAIVTWRHRSGPVETWGSSVQLSVGLWAFLTLCTVSSVPLELKLFWFRSFLVVPPLLTVTTLCFVFHFTGRGDWLTRPRLVALFLFPVATLVLVATNHVHGYMFVDPRVAHGSVSLLEYDLQWGTYAVFGLSYALVVVHSTMLSLKILRSRNVYRRIAFVIIVTTVGSTSMTLFSLAEVSPAPPHFMLLPLAYLAFGTLLIVGTSSITVAKKVPVDRLLSVLGSQRGAVVPLARDFVVEAVDNGIIVFDRNDRVVDVNSTAKRLAGGGRPVGKHVTALVPSEIVLRAGDLEAVLDGSEPVRELREELWVRLDDRERCYDVRVSALGDDDDPVGHVALIHDITEQKRREDQLRAREQELELQKEQLEYQNERLDRFAGIVSHDLRNPLNVAQGYLETILSEVEDTDADDGPAEVSVSVEYLEEVERSHDRMGDIIEDALALARQGKAITETESVTLSVVAKDAWANVETRKATLELGDDCSVVADRDRLLNVFENLFRNSLEHGTPSDEEDDHASPTVRVGRLADGTGFYVEDNGPGIPDDRKESVLEEGYTTATDGTGFGLAIVRDVVTAHGWSIAVTDAADGGARFEISGVDQSDVDDPALPPLGRRSTE
ncbi:histidine kinase N-terminal 7TM domain-containing protein [Natrinema salinisoli]|uniref:histidine kinase N-terminal 7TM domain-containing protein n=1 Tax=Natrinema salinisoli TaxID=2878535 RepID=UPI001CEFDD3F|nr:histidine kinase N-terminal 7TM domain-containing protein [Natrinema salinisoli]